jgi:hypothetical protein
MGLREARALEKKLESMANIKHYSKQLEQLIANILLSLDQTGYAKHDPSRTPYQVVELLRKAKRSTKVAKQIKQRIGFILERLPKS